MFRYNSEYVAVIYINVPIIIHCVHSNTNSVPIIPVLITVIIQSTILQYNNDDYYSNSSLKTQRCPKWQTVSTKNNQLFSTTEVYSLQNPNTN